MEKIYEIFSERLKRARIMRGLSMDKLCQLMQNKVSKQTISKYEKGINLPGSDVLISLSQALNVKPDYFFRSSDCTIAQVEFRKKSKLGAKKIESIKEIIRDKIERYLEIETILELNYSFENPIKDVKILCEEDVLAAAREIREEWELGEDGISNVTELLEAHNIKVIEIDEDVAFDGLSGYVNQDPRIPFIVINKRFTPERKRFTALHELGHIVMNLDNVHEKSDIEKFCHLFASEMLIPGLIFKKMLGSRRVELSLNELIFIQDIFGISIEAMMYKAKVLDIISESKYIRFCIDKNKKEDFKELVEKSRYGIDEDSSRFRMLVYKALASDIITTSKASVLLDLPIEDVKRDLILV